MLVKIHLEEAWKHTFFSTIPKSGELTNPRNWRPLEILNITYQMFARMVRNRVQRQLVSQSAIKKTNLHVVLLLTKRCLML